MAITTATDTIAIKAMLDTDGYLNSLGYISSNIFRYSINSENVTKDTKGIYIYHTAPDGDVQGFTTRQVYTINVIGAKSKWGDVINASEQVMALLTDLDIGNNHVLQLRYPPMTMSSAEELVVQELAFIVETPIYTAIKTI